MLNNSLMPIIPFGGQRRKLESVFLVFSRQNPVVETSILNYFLIVFVENIRIC